MIHIAISIVGLIGVLSTLSTESTESKDYGWYCSILHAIAVFLELVALLIAVLYWGVNTRGEYKRWYMNGAIVLGIFLAIANAITVAAAVAFIGFVAKEKALPSAVQSSGDRSVDF
jgi:fluoride ion exporter CrcB/FEX